MQSGFRIVSTLAVSIGLVAPVLPSAQAQEHVPVGHGRAYPSHVSDDDITLVTFGNGVPMSLRAARRLAADGIGARVFDLRWLAPLPVVALCCAGSGLALVLISVATAVPVLLASNFLYTWAIVAASVTMRSLRQVLVPRELLGRVTASWRFGGQAVTLVGGVVAGALAALLGNNPRPVIASAGCLTLLTVAVAWFAALQKENASGAAVRLLGK